MNIIFIIRVIKVKQLRLFFKKFFLFKKKKVVYKIRADRSKYI